MASRDGREGADLKRSVATFVNDTYEEELYDDREGTALGRVHITRSFSGDLEGRSTAELLTAVTGEGSAAYVAIDRISGRLDGREGSFVLQHHGTVSAREALTAGSVVPDSATGELRGLRGRAQIVVHDDGTHELVLEYELDE
ncbi:hypothetical protein BH18ACT15_BH18ACT15_07080 [soil metagenome]